MTAAEHVTTLDDARFRRSDSQFFHRGEIKKALVELAGHDEVVLYCGAGVTIDRTGLGWTDLIMHSLRPRDDENRPYIEDADLVKLERAIGNPQRLASVLRQHCVQRYPGEAAQLDYIASALRAELYRRNTWKGGRLVDTLSRYAVNAARAGKRITITTTNYDTYIEQAIDNELKRLTAIDEPRPGLHVETLGRSSPRTKVQPTAPELGVVRLVYLHGRIPPNDRVTGPIVLDEADYADNRGKTVARLMNLIDRPGIAVLVVGASLTDPPLIDAFALTRTRKPRYVLMPMQSTGLAAYPGHHVPALLKHLRGRFGLLGLIGLVPDFKVQIGQFFEELIVCENLVDPAGYERRSYGRRLMDWWEDWEARSDNDAFIDDAFGRLRDFSADLRRRWDLGDEKIDGVELVKLEIWARWNPEKSRRLALWGSSMGVLVGRGLLRKTELELDSGQASVRCFTEGRPQYVDLDEVQPPHPTTGGKRYRSRWESFLSVPVYLEDPDRSLITGVVTLASSRSRAGSAVPTSDTLAMQVLVTEMRTLGAELLA
ncbi:SIR2 family protein [Amycolatopsis sp.]|uniref:SIR2 family protein n=1 Tax=Amycolatopsis sp. TaxID=37632 RepID=UPI002C2CCCCE|nr:SIR2 family protein [Amycolatopsis sp.]HVV12215.1 SIR2 family protein [Amycolatopsis sp.]